MFLSPNTPELVERVYTEGKFWIALSGFLWAVFKGTNWIKEIKEKDLPKMQTTIEKVSAELKEQSVSAAVSAKEHTITIVNGFKEQTAQLVRELQEQRQDFRAFYMPQVAQARAAKPRTRKPVTRAVTIATTTTTTTP